MGSEEIDEMIRGGTRSDPHDCAQLEAGLDPCERRGGDRAFLFVDVHEVRSHAKESRFRIAGLDVQRRVRTGGASLAARFH